MNKYLDQISNVNEQFLRDVIIPKISILEDALKTNQLAQKLCTHSKILDDYRGLYKLSPKNQSGKTNIQKIVNQLFPEYKNTNVTSPDSAEFETVSARVQSLENISRRRIYVNFIYGIKDGIESFEFGRITQDEHNKLSEDGGKHIQIGYGYHLLYAGTMVFNRNGNNLKIVINPKSGRWFLLMQDLIEKLPASFWNFLIPTAREETKTLKYETLNILLIKRVEQLFRQTYRTLPMPLEFGKCHHVMLLNMYKTVAFDTKCVLDINEFITNLEKSVEHKTKRQR